jgi:hypothetical protein
MDYYDDDDYTTDFFVWRFVILLQMKVLTDMNSNTRFNNPGVFCKFMGGNNICNHSPQQPINKISALSLITCHRSFSSCHPAIDMFTHSW